MQQRVLVTISISFSIRYIVRTGLLDMMRDFCEPVVAITWNQGDLIDELRARGYEVYLVPAEQRAKSYIDVRRKIDIWFEHFCLTSMSTKIQRAYLDQFTAFKSRLISRLRRMYNLIKLLSPGFKKQLFLQEEQLLVTSTNIDAYFHFVDQLTIDAVFTVTPFHRQEDLLLRACKLRNKKMMTSILSFDNITKRGWIPFLYDLYLVWNEDNKKQLYRIYPATKYTIVKVTGAAQFDFYFKPEYVLSRDEWERVVGIDGIKGRKVILYAGGPGNLFPNEAQYLIHLDEAINSGKIKGNPLILFRCHPTDKIERWKAFTADCTNIVFDISWTGPDNVYHANVSESDVMKLCSTLFYTDVHINLCSTMTVDGSAYDKPQIGPAYDTINPAKQTLLERMYLQEHFEKIIHSGCLKIARSKQQLISLVNEALKVPEQCSKERISALTEVIGYTDGSNTKRVIEALKTFMLPNDVPKQFESTSAG